MDAKACPNLPLDVLFTGVLSVSRYRRGAENARHSVVLFILEQEESSYNFNYGGPLRLRRGHLHNKQLKKDW